jgi:hypothetical protein
MIMSEFEPTVPVNLVAQLNEAGVIAEDGTLHEDPGKVVITLSPGQAQRYLLYLKRRLTEKEQESKYLPSDLGTSLDDPETAWTAPFRRRQQS